MSTYLGLTIGPIVKTLSMAESTRELWAASYTIAYLVKEIAKRFDKQYPNRTWYKPALGQLARATFDPAAGRFDHIESLQAVERPLVTGVGIFPDHLILDSTDEADTARMRTVVLEVLDAFAEEVQRELAVNAPSAAVYDVGEIQAYFRQYFQINIIRKTLTVEEQQQGPIIAMTSVLSVAEMRTSVPDTHSNVLKEYFGLRGRTLLTKDAFADARKEIRSIPEIALHALIDQDPDLQNKIQRSVWDRSDDADHTLDIARQHVRDQNRKNPKKAKPLLAGHKYIAIVHADGDGVGKFLQALPPEKWGAFSEALSAFSVEAAGIIQNEYGGLPVYLGGDDALFFAPVIYGDISVFTLCRYLNERFVKRMSSFSTETLTAPTLSFGVSITYAKYPLYEALKISMDLLFGPAKRGLETSEPGNGALKDEDRKYVKNNIAFSLLKGSGNLFGGLLHLSKQEDYSVLDAFLEVFKNFQGDDGRALRSIIYDLPANQVLYRHIATDKTKLANYLANSFDEDIHQGEAVVSYLEAVATLIHHVYIHWRRYPSLDDYIESREEANRDTLIPNRMAYGLLKTILFLTAPEVSVETTPAHA